jgi:hypothetical protein
MQLASFLHILLSEYDWNRTFWQVICEWSPRLREQGFFHYPGCTR